MALTLRKVICLSNYIMERVQRLLLEEEIQQSTATPIENIDKKNFTTYVSNFEFVF